MKTFKERYGISKFDYYFGLSIITFGGLFMTFNGIMALVEIFSWPWHHGK